MESANSRIKTLSILAIIGLGFIVYSNSFFCSFHFDDDVYVINDFAIRNIHNLLDIGKVCPCRFITFLSLALNYHFNGLNVFGYHLFNIAVHLGTSILVWWLILLTFSTPVIKKEKIARHKNSIALLAALIYVSHPVQIEAVTYIWQRAASMTAFFYLLSLSLYVKSRLFQDEKFPGAKKYYICSIITAVAAMFTKENAITLPLMILLYEFSFLKTKKGIDWGQLYPFWMILFIIPLTMSLTRTSRVGEIQSIVSGPHGISPIHYFFTQLRVIITYMRLTVLPINLNLDYDYPIFRSFFEIPVLTSFIFLTAILYFAQRLFSKYRLISFSIFWFFLTLLPESSILPQTDVIFEHRLYLPMVGYCIFLVSGAYYGTELFYRHSEPFASLEGRLREESKGALRSFVSLRMTMLVLSTIIAFNSVLTYQRNKIWKNEIVLWADVIQKSPHKARPYINHGWAFYNQGDFTSSMADYNKAITISPELIYPYDDRGLIYARQGSLLKAIAEYTKAIKISPYYPKVYYHRALAYFMQKNYPQALSDYNKAIELDGEYVDAYNDRAQLYASQGNLTQAIADYKKSIKIDPNQPNIIAKF